MRDGDEMNEAMYNHLIHMVGEFAKEKHSGFSGIYAVGCLHKLLKFEPLQPLQGTDDEWTEVADSLYQNIRCGRVFKDGEGNAYNIDGKVFVQPDGLSYTSADSRVEITFPYTPKTEYVHIEKEQQ